METRPNIIYTMSIMSRLTKNLSYLYSKAVKTIFYYLKDIKDSKIIYGGEQVEELIIRKYFNSNWVGNHITKKSILDFLFMFNGRLVNWCLKQ